MLPFPVWRCTDIRDLYAELNETDAWTHSECVRTSMKNTTEKALVNAAADDKLNHIVHLTCGAFLQNLLLASIAQGRKKENLRSFHFCSWIDERTTLMLETALPYMPALEQLNVSMFNSVKSSMNNFFVALSNLTRLTALSISFSTSELQQGDALAEAVIKVRGTLRSLEISGPDKAFMGRFCQKLAHASLTKLEILVVSTNELLEPHMVDLCIAMQHMPRLCDLHFGTICGPESVRALAHHFATSYRPLQSLHLCFQQLSPEQSDLAQLIRKNTRLTHLNFSGTVHYENFAELAQDGWLITFGGNLPDAQRQSILHVVKRNLARRNACRLACLALVCVRKKKASLLQHPWQVVVIIARYLWETRNRIEWDDI